MVEAVSRNFARQRLDGILGTNVSHSRSNSSYTPIRAYRTGHNGQFSPAPVASSSGRDQLGPARFGPPRRGDGRAVSIALVINIFHFILRRRVGGHESVPCARGQRDEIWVTPTVHLLY